jgi:hypothetical protein
MALSKVSDQFLKCSGVSEIKHAIRRRDTSSFICIHFLYTQKRSHNDYRRELVMVILFCSFYAQQRILTNQSSLVTYAHYPQFCRSIYFVPLESKYFP